MTTTPKHEPEVRAASIFMQAMGDAAKAAGDAAAEADEDRARLDRIGHDLVDRVLKGRMDDHRADGEG